MVRVPPLIQNELNKIPKEHIYIVNGTKHNKIYIFGKLIASLPRCKFKDDGPARRADQKIACRIKRAVSKNLIPTYP
jgi:hypothetical protein